MPTPSFAANKNSLKSRAIQTAQQLILKNGLQNVSMRKVAQKCKVTPMALYKHFANKNDLIAIVIQTGFQSLEKYLITALQHKSQTPRQKLLALTQGYLKFALEHPAYYRIMFSETDAQLHLNPKKLLPQEQSQASLKFSKAFQLFFGHTKELYNHFNEVDQLEKTALIWSQMHGLISIYQNNLFQPVIQSKQQFIDFFQRSMQFHIHNN